MSEQFVYLFNKVVQMAFRYMAEIAFCLFVLICNTHTPGALPCVCQVSHLFGI